MLSVYWAKLGFDAGNAAGAEFDYEGIIQLAIYLFILETILYASLCIAEWWRQI